MKWLNFMKKINIVKYNRDFDNIIKNGIQIKNKIFNIYYIKNTNGYYRIGISVPKKIGNAVCRNKIKRQIKDIIDKNIKFKTNYDIILITKNTILDYNYNEIKELLINTMEKI